MLKNEHEPMTWNAAMHDKKYGMSLERLRRVQGCRTTYEYAQQHPGSASKMRLDFEDELKRGFFGLDNYEGMTMWTSSTAHPAGEARGGVSATHASPQLNPKKLCTPLPKEGRKAGGKL